MKKSFCFLVLFLWRATLANTSLALADQFVESSSFSPVLLHFQWRTPKPIPETTSEEEEEDYVSLARFSWDFSESQGEDVFSGRTFWSFLEILLLRKKTFLASVDIPEAEKTAYLNRLAEQSSWLQENVSASKCNRYSCFWCFGESTSSSVPDTESFFDAPDARFVFRIRQHFFQIWNGCSSCSATFEEVPFFQQMLLPMLRIPYWRIFKKIMTILFFLWDSISRRRTQLWSARNLFFSSRAYYVGTVAMGQKGAVGCLRDMVCTTSTLLPWQ